MTRNPTILFVDETKWFRELGALFVGRSGRVLTAGSAEEALEIARREQPDLVITDLAMPGTDGAALCATLRADADLADTPVIVLIGSERPIDHARAMRAGANDLLTKPLSRFALLESVNRLLRDGFHGRPRVQIAEPVRLRVSDETAWGTLINVSRGGAFVEAPAAIPSQVEVALDFTLPGSTRPICSTAEVVWSTPPSADQPGVGLGMRFVEIDRRSLHALETYVFEHGSDRGIPTGGPPQ